MLAPDAQGYGFMLEAARAYFDYLFTQKGTRRIYLYTEEDNLSCQRLSEKLGMRKEGVFREFVTFVNDEKGDPLYETTLQYAILKKKNGSLNVFSHTKKSPSDRGIFSVFIRGIWKR